MTTIAYRDGVLAADTKGTDDNGYHPGTYRCEKLFRVDGDIIATAGEDATGMIFVDWYGSKKNGKRPKPPARLVDGAADFAVLILRKDGLYWSDKWCRMNKIMDEIYALGSGAPYALGAMAMGAPPEEAVRIAMRWDCYTGGDIVTMRLES
jgi:hypothetical protein